MTGMFWLSKIKTELPYDTSFSRKCAYTIIKENKHEDIETLIKALLEEDENVALICSNILFEISQIKPSMLETEVSFFIKIFEKEKNNIHHNCIRILTALVPIKHKEIYKGLNNISDAFFNGEDGVKNGFVELLVALAMISSDYYKECCSALKVILEYYPPDNIISYAEKVLPVIDKTNCEDFKEILNQRKHELNTSGQKAIERILSSSRLFT